MVKLAVRPLGDRVTSRACGCRRRKPCANVVRHSAAERRRAIPGRLVAAVAVRVRGSKGIVIALVAIHASHNFARRRQLMRTGQRPAGCGVIEHYVGPQRRVVAGGAIGRRKRRARRRVHRIVGLLPGGQVASGIPAIRRADLQIVIVVEVAVRAGGHLARRCHLVRVCQRKTGGRMVKIRCQPGNRIMASGARRNRKYCGRRRMLGVRRLLPGCEMASGIPAVRRRDFQIEVAAHVAIQTGNIRVPVRKRKTDRRRGVVYAGAQPTVKRVARIAGLRELTGHVVGALGLLKISHMAGAACR